eukprot:2599899-Lingulodinium_polyedra.AAC.1
MCIRDRLLPTLPPPNRGRAAAPAWPANPGPLTHQWYNAGGLWRRLVCGSTALDDGTRRRRRTQRCPGFAGWLHEFLARPGGRRVVLAVAD